MKKISTILFLIFAIFVCVSLSQEIDSVGNRPEDNAVGSDKGSDFGTDQTGDLGSKIGDDGTEQKPVDVSGLGDETNDDNQDDDDDDFQDDDDMVDSGPTDTGAQQDEGSDQTGDLGSKSGDDGSEQEPISTSGTDVDDTNGEDSNGEDANGEDKNGEDSNGEDGNNADDDDMASGTNAGDDDDVNAGEPNGEDDLEDDNQDDVDTSSTNSTSNASNASNTSNSTSGPSGGQNSSNNTNDTNGPKCLNNCSGHGDCKQHILSGLWGKRFAGMKGFNINYCKCNKGFKGKDCSIDSSKNSCNKSEDCGDCRGKCVRNQCYCFKDFGGNRCSEKRVKECDFKCQNQGQCMITTKKYELGKGKGKDKKFCMTKVHQGCRCEYPYFGKTCSFESKPKTCRQGCGDNGTCRNGICFCNQGFWGHKCQLQSDN